MRLLRIIFVVLAVVTGMSIATQAVAADVCPASCEGRWQDRALLLATGDTYGDVSLMWNLSATRWLRPPSGLTPISVDEDGDPQPEVVYTEKDLLVQLKWAALNCYRIKYLSVFSHGSPGRIYFRNTPFGISNLDSLRDYACVMAENAEIVLGGCNVARGCEGQNFMAGLATRLLPRGGTVRANTFYASTFIPGVIPHTSLNLDTQTIFVRPGTGGPEIDTTQDESGWDNRPASGTECRQELSECLLGLDAQVRRVGSCALDQAQAAIVGEARRTLTGGGSLVLHPASEFDARIGDAAIAESSNFAVHMRNCTYWKKTIEDYDGCEAPTSAPVGTRGARPAR